MFSLQPGPWPDSPEVPGRDGDAAGRAAGYPKVEESRVVLLRTVVENVIGGRAQTGSWPFRSRHG